MRNVKQIKGLTSQGGFSLVELMIVVGIIGVLATLALPRFQQFQAKAKMAEARNMLGHIYTLEQAYHLDNNTYLAFGQVGRMANKSVVCTNVPSQQLGFQINPCTGNVNDPVPRFGYTVGNVSTSQFIATAQTGNGDDNLVCPGGGIVRFRNNQDNNITDNSTIGSNAVQTCRKN